METLDTRFKWQEATGRAKYIADRHYDGLLEGRFFRSSCPRGLIKAVRLPELPDGYHVFGAKDVPGKNELPIVLSDWPAFADKEVRFIGQVIFLVVGKDPAVVEKILGQIQVDYEPLTPAYTISQSKALIDGAIHSDNNILDSRELIKGNIDKAFANAVTIIEEDCATGYQEHIYLETQGCVGYFNNGKVVIEGSMQCPYYVHHCMQTVLGHNDVRAIQVTTGGGFGGKEDYPDVLAGPIAVAVNKLKQPVRIILERSEDIQTTSKRHPVAFHYKTGIDSKGQIVAMDVKFDINSGAYLSLSGIVLQRAITTLTNVYHIPHVRVNGHAWTTNTVPTGAFRGFGSPQTCFCIETHMSHIAKALGRDPIEFKQAHFLKTGGRTFTGAEIFGDIKLDDMLAKAKELSLYDEKISLYAKQDAKTAKKKGIGMSIFQHGCGFAGDLEQTLVKSKVKLIKDNNDELYILASNTDLGQGLSLTFRQIVAKSLNVSLDTIHLAVPDTDVVPDSGPTVASRSILIVGYLLEKAADKLGKIWIDGEHQEIEEDYQKPEYHRWDQQKFEGNAYQATSYGINVVEVEVDTATGETEIKDVWAIYEIGKAIDAQVFRGQIDGGLVQALGYGGLEKLEMKPDGTFAQKTMADYVIPTALDVPYIISELIDNPYEYGPYGAKGGGELTHNGGAAALAAAIENAIGKPISAIPVTPERVCQILNCDDQAHLQITELNTGSQRVEQ